MSQTRHFSLNTFSVSVVFFASLFLIHTSLFAPLADAAPTPPRPALLFAQQRVSRRSENPAWTVLIKRAKEPMPTQAQCDAAMADPGVPCMFYTSHTEGSAYQYSLANNYATLTDERLDVEGWAGWGDNSPIFKGRFPVEAGTGTADDAWNQAEEQQFWNMISSSMAKVCSGVAYVALGSDYSIPGNSVFNLYELPYIKENFASGQITALIAVPMVQSYVESDDGSPTPVGPLKTLLPCASSTPETGGSGSS